VPDQSSNSSSCPFTPVFAVLNSINSSYVEAWSSDLSSSLSAPTTAFAAALLVASLALLFFGARVVKASLAFGAFACAALGSYYGMHAILSAVSAGPTVQCYVLFAVPMVAGIAAGILAVRLLRLAFACLGVLAGGALGLFLYKAILNQYPLDVNVLGHDGTFWLCALLPAALGAAAMVRWEHSLLAVATSVVGAVCLVIALAWLVLSHIDARFLWILSDDERDSQFSSPFVYSQAIAGMVYVVLGIAVQHKMEKRRKIRDDDDNYRRLEVALLRP